MYGDVMPRTVPTRPAGGAAATRLAARAHRAVAERSASRGGWLLAGADLGATFVFAVEGGYIGAVAGAGIVGIPLMAFLTAIGGGIIRDLVLGEPPATLRTLRYPLTALAGGLLVAGGFDLHSVPTPLVVALDAAALGLFVIAGASKSLDRGRRLITAIVLGAVSGVGGGAVRDLLLDRIPATISTSPSTVAGLAGAAIALIGLRYGRGNRAVVVLVFAACVTLQVVAVWQGWSPATLIR